MQNTRLALELRLLAGTTRFRLMLILLLALAFRCALLMLIHNPGLHDPVHYYNLGRRLSHGQGFTIDYVWHYGQLPADIAHPVDHWMPLAGVAAALGMQAAGESVHGALGVFLLAGAMAPLVTFVAAKRFWLSDACALFAAALAGFLPELVLNSLRTDTTIINMMLLSACLLGFDMANARRRPRYLLLSGCLLGLAYLTRNDSILLLPILLALLLIARGPRPLRAAMIDMLLLSLAFAVAVSPWLARNLREIGLLTSPLSARMPFMLEPIELYAYGFPITLESMLSRQSPVELLATRLFELAAACKQMAVSLQLPLAILAPSGLVMLLRARDGRRLRRIMPALIWILGILIAYPLLMPVHHQGGSFKKAFLSALPLLIPLGAFATWRLVNNSRQRKLFALIATLWLVWGGYDLVKREAEFADTYHRSIQVLLDGLASLPDINGDGEIRLMSQDPYVFSYYGLATAVTPLATREDTLDLARMYRIDYLMMPAARPALDSLYLGAESDPRFQLAAHIADAGEIPWELYRLVY